MKMATTHYLGALACGMVMLVDATGSAVAMARREEVFQGIAKNDQGEITYIEEHRLIYENGRHQRNETRYRNAEGKEFAIMTSNFTAHPYVPTYTFEDQRFGREDRAKVDGRSVRTFGRASEDAPVRESRLKLTDTMVTGQGLHFFLRDHLAELVQGSAVKTVQFIVPLEGTYYTFRIRRLDFKSGTVTFAIEADNWLLRLLAPKLQVQYDLTTRRLISYRGPSNLLSDSRTVQNVTITYRYLQD
jgi:hypothetical protein